MIETTTQAERRIARSHCDAPNNTPVVVVPGALAPRYVGVGCHYTNRSGSQVYHPNAYARKGFSSLVYRHSTLRVEVGARWLDRRHAW